MIDLRFSDLRILIEKSAGDVVDVAPFLDSGSTVEIGRSEPSPDMPCISGCRFKLAKAYNDPNFSESFDKKTNSRLRPGRKVTIQIYWDGAWRSPPFGATTYIKFSFYRDTGTHEEVEIETQGKLAQVIEEDKAFDPERKYDSAGNPVSQTRDVLGVTRTLADIINSYLHVKAVGPVVNSAGFMTQTTNTYKEYLGDSSDSEINFANQLVWYNCDRPSELNFLYENQAGETAIASIPLDLAIVTPAKRLIECTWGLYTTDLITYEPERNVEQLAEFVEVIGVASVAQARPLQIVDNNPPPQLSGISLNTTINPITAVEVTTTFDYSNRIETVTKTYSTPEAITPGSSGGGIGTQLVQHDVNTKYFDGQKRLIREVLTRRVPDAIKLGTVGSSGGTVGTDAYRRETLYNLSSNDKVLSTIVHETVASAIAGGSATNPADLVPLNSGIKKSTDLGNGVYAGSTYVVANIGLAQGSTPYFPASYAGNDERAQPPQCEYYPDRYYVQNTPLRRRVQITWGTGLQTGRITTIDVGNAILTGQNFALLANSLARLHTARHEQYNCSFPLSTGLFTDWQIPGKIISVLESAKNKRHHYFTGADSIKISKDSIICETTLFWIGTTDETSGAIDAPNYDAIATETNYLITGGGDNYVTGGGDRITLAGT